MHVGPGVGAGAGSQGQLWTSFSGSVTSCWQLESATEGTFTLWTRAKLHTREEIRGTQNGQTQWGCGVGHRARGCFRRTPPRTTLGRLVPTLTLLSGWAFGEMGHTCALQLVPAPLGGDRGGLRCVLPGPA